MTIFNRGPGPFPHLASDAVKYRALADDLDELARGIHPNAERLSEAPILFEWKLRINPIPHLLGIVMGHPKIPDGSSCRTSELITIDVGQRYARTFSRFYRLGDRAE